VPESIAQRIFRLDPAIRYGSLYQLVIRYGTGHASVGVELSGDPVAIAEKVCGELGLRAGS